MLIITSLTMTCLFERPSCFQTVVCFHPPTTINQAMKSFFSRKVKNRVVYTSSLYLWNKSELGLNDWLNSNWHCDVTERSFQNAKANDVFLMLHNPTNQRCWKHLTYTNTEEQEVTLVWERNSMLGLHSKMLDRIRYCAECAMLS